ncbi:hypothetical protein B0H14DRAFT_3538781 [Mycena olivaceomarginata]|nr:hypothetical protein B0H14DRAFT_3538781 [Mycena olivaceomarginata]
MSQVCAPDADITLSSSSGRLFRVHRKNLETHSSAFASASAATAAQPEPEPEPVALTEPSDVLELVLQFMYPQPQPDLRALDFRTLAALAEAVEKYEVHSALAICRSQMESFVCTNPLEVLVYALRHGHTNLVNEAAQQSMRCGVAEAMDILPPETFRDWVRLLLLRLLPIVTALTFFVRSRFTSAGTRATATSLGYMATFPKHVPLVQKCTADPNPACTFRAELDAAGGWSRAIREMHLFVLSADSRQVAK